MFHSLDLPQIEAILDLQLEELTERIAEQGYSLRLEPEARELLVKKGWDPKYGARPLRRVIQKELEDPISMQILELEQFGLKDKSQETIFIAGAKEGVIAFEAKVAEPASIIVN